MGFDPPATGKIAIKVINHYGDEVLKVLEVETPRTGRSDDPLGEELKRMERRGANQLPLP